MRVLYTILLCAVAFVSASAQADTALAALLALEDEEPQTTYAQAEFKTTRVVNNQSLLLLPAGILDFRIMHRFGALNSGAYHLFGLDNAVVRLQFDYGVNQWLNVGFGRSALNKVYGGFAKARLLHQSTGEKNMPVTVLAHSHMGYNGIRFQDSRRNRDIMPRLWYAHQLIVGRKFSPDFSAQLVPTYIHNNLQTHDAAHDNFALGAGARMKVSRRVTINGEYFYNFDGPGRTFTDPLGTRHRYRNYAGLGVDIETGGHVFQLFLANTQAMEERNFIAANTGDIAGGDIFFGFNISRVFHLKNGGGKW